MSRQPWRTIAILLPVVAAIVCGILFLPTPVLIVAAGWLGTSLLFAGLLALAFQHRWSRRYVADLRLIREAYDAQVIEEAERIVRGAGDQNA